MRDLCRSGLLLLGLVLLAGCRRQGFFWADGSVKSAGGGLGRWSAKPSGCSRDPFLGGAEGLPVARPQRSLVSFQWEDLSGGSQRPDLYRRFAPDQPRRLQIARAGDGYVARLETMRLTQGTRIESSACKVFQLQTWEVPATQPSGRPVLSGKLTLDCMVRDAQPDADPDAVSASVAPAKLPPSHLTAKLSFEFCGF